ncbi:MAG TPA: ABC transporter substrate-binding protein, partial [Pseudomonadota bacterium]|nr:ABC transporter substrate-binding protein [Pseudomonadota bacterium]
MKRREFITLVGGATAWPLVARAQQSERIRRIGVLMNLAADDPEGQARITAFAQGLQEAGWTMGRNVRIDYRWAGADADRHRQHATELVALAPDIILAATTISLAAVQQVTRTIPIVFVQVIDPVSGGFVDTLAHPGGNATGFTTFEYGISGKWLELLKEIAPGVTRAAIIRNPTTASQIGQLGAIQAAALSFGMELRPIDVRGAGEIERAVTAFARSSNGGLIVLSGSSSLAHRELIITLAAKERLPAVYSDRVFV